MMTSGSSRLRGHFPTKSTGLYASSLCCSTLHSTTLLKHRLNVSSTRVGACAHRTSSLGRTVRSRFNCRVRNFPDCHCCRNGSVLHS